MYFEEKIITMSIKPCKHLCKALYDRILQVILSKIIVMVYIMSYTKERLQLLNVAVSKL